MDADRDNRSRKRIGATVDRHTEAHLVAVPDEIGFVILHALLAAVEEGPVQRTKVGNVQRLKTQLVSTAAC